MLTSNTVASQPTRHRSGRGERPLWLRTVALAAVMAAMLSACSSSGGGAGGSQEAAAPAGGVPGNPSKEQAAHVQAELANSYTLGPGDRVRVTVFGHEDLSGEFEVDGSGMISPPLVRDIKAQGLTVRQVEKIIADRLSPDYLKNPSVSVEVMNYRPFYIFGEVNAPGSYPYVNGMTVVNAVAMAGGYTYRARTGSARLTRATDTSRTPETVDRDTPVLPGDVIEVPERYF
jgi:protein involved in polysaccharide export with SLBB domain